MPNECQPKRLVGEHNPIFFEWIQDSIIKPNPKLDIARIFAVSNLPGYSGEYEPTGFVSMMHQVFSNATYLQKKQFLNLSRNPVPNTTRNPSLLTYLVTQLVTKSQTPPVTLVSYTTP